MLMQVASVPRALVALSRLLAHNPQQELYVSCCGVTGPPGGGRKGAHFFCRLQQQKQHAEVQDWMGPALGNGGRGPLCILWTALNLAI